MASRGVYNTKQKESILNYLSKRPMRRVSADELAHALEVGKTTAYRHLEALARAGATRKYIGGNGETCYQYVEDANACSRHSHWICTDCGEMLHIDCERMDELAKHMLSSHGFRLDAEKSVLYGRCASCLEEEKNGVD